MDTVIMIGLACKPMRLVTVALANKMAGIAWAVMNSHGKFQFPLWRHHVIGRVTPGHHVDFIHYFSPSEPRMSHCFYRGGSPLGS